MALPHVFANVTELDCPALDDNFNALGAITVISCTATGTNAIALTPVANTPTIAAYSNEAPVFGFVAAATSTGNVTINVAGVGALNLYKTHGSTQAAANDIVIGGIYYVAYDLSLNSGAGGFVLLTDQSATKAPSISVFTSGSAQTYTTPVGAVYLRVTMCGGGGGGGAQATNAGSVGTDTSFGTWTAIHGNGGGVGGANAGGAGGTGGVNGTGTVLTRVDGGDGWPGNAVNTAPGGAGGSNPLGGAGVPSKSSGAGGNAKANTGAGGGGASSSSTANAGGGGAGEFVDFIITSPAATYTYTVGGGGNGGAAGTLAGGNGAAGRIVVLAFT